VEAKTTPLTLEEIAKAFLKNTMTSMGTIAEVPERLYQHSLRLLDFASNQQIDSIFNAISKNPEDRWIFFGCCITMNFLLSDPMLMLNVVMKENLTINIGGCIFKTTDIAEGFRKHSKKIIAINSLIREALFSFLDSDKLTKKNPLAQDIRTAFINYHNSFRRENAAAIKKYITSQENLIITCIETVVNELNFNTKNTVTFAQGEHYNLLEKMLWALNTSADNKILEAECLTATPGLTNIARAASLMKRNQTILVGIHKVMKALEQFKTGKESAPNIEAHSLKTFNLISAIKNQDHETFYAILQQKPDLDFFDAKLAPNPPLHLAVTMGLTEMASALIENGANVNGANAEGLSPIFLTQDNLQIARLLLENKARVNVEDESGATPLLVTIKRSPQGNTDLKFISLLIEFGANIHALNSQGYSPLYIAACYGKTPIVDFLLSKGAKIDQQSLAPKGPMMRPNLGEHGMAFIPYYICDQMILPMGQAPTPSVGATPLFGAVNNRHVGTATLLLERGANPNTRTIRGQSNLHAAFINKHFEMVQLLVARGANANQLSAESSPPFLASACILLPEAIPLMIQKGAEIHTCMAAEGVSMQTKFALYRHGEVANMLSIEDSTRYFQQLRQHFSKTKEDLNSIINLAFATGKFVFLKELLQKGSLRCNDTFTNNDSLLIYALNALPEYFDPSEDLINHLLKLPDINCNQRNDFKKKPLHVALCNNRSEHIIESLIKKTTLRFKAANECESYIWLAVEHQHSNRIIELLLEQGANPNEHSKEVECPFIRTLRLQPQNTELLAMLLDNGVLLTELSQGLEAIMAFARQQKVAEAILEKITMQHAEETLIHNRKNALNSLVLRVNECLALNRDGSFRTLYSEARYQVCILAAYQKSCNLFTQALKRCNVTFEIAEVESVIYITISNDALDLLLSKETSNKFMEELSSNQVETDALYIPASNNKAGDNYVREKARRQHIENDWDRVACWNAAGNPWDGSKQDDTFYRSIKELLIDGRNHSISREQIIKENLPQYQKDRAQQKKIIKAAKVTSHTPSSYTKGKAEKKTKAIHAAVESKSVPASSVPKSTKTAPASKGFLRANSPIANNNNNQCNTSIDWTTALTEKKSKNRKENRNESKPLSTDQKLRLTIKSALNEYLYLEGLITWRRGLEKKLPIHDEIFEDNIDYLILNLCEALAENDRLRVIDNKFGDQPSTEAINSLFSADDRNFRILRNNVMHNFPNINILQDFCLNIILPYLGPRIKFYCDGKLANSALLLVDLSKGELFHCQPVDIDVNFMIEKTFIKICNKKQYLDSKINKLDEAFQQLGIQNSGDSLFNSGQIDYRHVDVFAARSIEKDLVRLGKLYLMYIEQPPENKILAREIIEFIATLNQDIRKVAGHQKDPSNDEWHYSPISYKVVKAKMNQAICLMGYFPKKSLPGDLEAPAIKAIPIPPATQAAHHPMAFFPPTTANTPPVVQTNPNQPTPAPAPAKRLLKLNPNAEAFSFGK
jgi:ankyrin repeat protein